MKNYPKGQGFTLIEMMITVVIVSIIATVAYPSYVTQVRKAKRSDAKVSLEEAAQRQESYFLRNYSYASSMTQLGYGSATPASSEGEYTLSISSLDSGGGACNGTNADACVNYTLSASPVTGGMQNKDTDCKTFSIDERGARTAKDSSNNASAVCWD